MRPFVGTLILEGVEDADGRTIAPGGLEWRTPLAIYDAERRRILGHAHAIDRVEEEIVAVGSIDLPVGEYGVGAGVVFNAEDAGDDGTHRTLLAGHLRDAAITSTPSFERARITVGRDSTDDKVERIVREAVRDAYLPDHDRRDDD